MTQNAFLLLEISPRFLLAYFAHRRDNDRCLRVWRLLLGCISQNPEKAELSIKPLLDAAQKDALPRYLKPGTGEVDALIDDLITQTLGGDPAYLPLVRQVLQTPGKFIVIMCMHVYLTFRIRLLPFRQRLYCVSESHNIFIHPQCRFIAY